MTSAIWIFGIGFLLTVSPVLRLYKKGERRAADLVIFLSFLAALIILLYFLHVRLPSLLSLLTNWMQRIGLYYSI